MHTPDFSSRFGPALERQVPDALKKVFKRIQEGVGELGDALLGDRIERAFDQDIRDVDQALRMARDDAASIKARRIRAEELAQETRSSLGQLEGEVSTLLRQRRKSAAREKAGLLVAMGERIVELDLQVQGARHSEQYINHLIEQLEHKLRRIKHQVGTLRAAASIQRAQAAVAKRRTIDAQHPEPAQAPAKRLRGRVQGATAPDMGSKSNKVSLPREQAIEQVIERLAMKAGGESRSARRTEPRPGARKAR